MNSELIVALLAAAIQSGTPILYATLGEMLTEKGGILNLGVEGILSVSALGAFLASFSTGAPWLGVLAGCLCGVLMASIHGLVCITFLGNQVVSGLALTIAGLGLASYFGTPFIGLAAPGFSQQPIPGLCDIPILGQIFFSHDVLVYLSYCAPIALWFLLRRTSLGMGIRAVGEMPGAASAAGLDPLRLRWVALLLGGALIGLGGAYLSLAYTHLWTNGLSGGRGWIAVALVIFAFWRPGRAVLGAYLFGSVMAFQLRLQASGATIPSSLLLMLPYALTIIALAFSASRSQNINAPAALGVNIEPED
ncbi:ABC transporter permease [Desulfovibrio inopinatus]|uniref:ABC transporter permease n=1 Tax=Desulfovibrio inopinatus TaxID=102109 RepID=UPI00042A92EA|nr:ABC transporter permease [Desulfovibrio inopinatus]